MIIVALTSAASALDVNKVARPAASAAVLSPVSFICVSSLWMCIEGRKTQVSAGGLRPKITPAEIFLLLNPDCGRLCEPGRGAPECHVDALELGIFVKAVAA